MKHVPGAAIGIIRATRDKDRARGQEQGKVKSTNRDSRRDNSTVHSLHAGAGAAGGASSSSVFDLNMDISAMSCDFEATSGGGGYSHNRSFRKTLRQAQHESHTLRSIQKHKLDESALNDILTELRAVTVFKAPDLLPLIRSVISGLADEREVWRNMAMAGEKG